MAASEALVLQPQPGLINVETEPILGSNFDNRLRNVVPTTLSTVNG
jgi:hypothetical protein